jgi:hypothetical protein
MMMRLMVWWTNVAERTRRDERGMTTAELLGNAALGIAALVVIWAALQALGVHIVDSIGKQLGL